MTKEEIENLTDEEMDELVQIALLHYAYLMHFWRIHGVYGARVEPVGKPGYPPGYGGPRP